MKKIINGTLFDTENAELIGSNYLDWIERGELHYVDEAFYCTLDGKCFLYCKRGTVREISYIKAQYLLTESENIEIWYE